MGCGSKFDSALSTRGGRANAVTANDIASNDPLAKDILDDMKNKNINFTKERIVFAARLENGNHIFLEKGNSKSGLIHIIERHGDDFSRADDQSEPGADHRQSADGGHQAAHRQAWGRSACRSNTCHARSWEPW